MAGVGVEIGGVARGWEEVAGVKVGSEKKGDGGPAIGEVVGRDERMTVSTA